MRRTRYYGGIFSLPIFKWQSNNHNHRDLLSKAKAKSSERGRVNVADMEHMTKHTLDDTICKIYFNPQDEVGTPPKDSSTNCKIHEAPKDEVPIAQLSTLTAYGHDQET